MRDIKNRWFSSRQFALPPVQHHLQRLRRDYGGLLFEKIETLEASFSITKIRRWVAASNRFSGTALDEREQAARLRSIIPDINYVIPCIFETCPLFGIRVCRGHILTGVGNFRGHVLRGLRLWQPCSRGFGGLAAHPLGFCLTYKAWSSSKRLVCRGHLETHYPDQRAY